MKKFASVFLSIIIVVSAFCGTNITAYAKDPIKTKTVDIDDIEFEENEITIKLDKPSVVYVDFELIVDENGLGNKYYDKLDGTNGIHFYLYNSKFSDDAVCKLPKHYYYSTYWYYSDEVLPAGKYTICIDFLKDNIVADFMKCKYKVYTYSGYSTSVNLPSKQSVEVNQIKEISLKDVKPSNTLSAPIWKVDNKKIAKVVGAEKNKVYIEGVKKGTCYLYATLQNGKKYKCKINVKKPSPKLNKDYAEIPFGDSIKLKMLYSDKKYKWSSSNKSIATVDSKGVVRAKKTGTCTITAKYGKKSYKCKVKVYRMWTDYVATLYDYNTRDNYFSVKFKNYGSKSLTILSDGAYCMDVDYKSYDRDLRLKGNEDIKIKPGETKTVKFYVKGSVTWYDYQDFTIRYYFKYNGAKYLGSVWDEDSVFKRGNSWYNTYYYTNDLYELQSRV